MKEIAIVILNWNGQHWLEKFLPSVIENSNQELCEIVIADNASSDASKDYVAQHFPSIKWIQLDNNYGYTGGYNRVLQQLSHTYFILLNSDIEVAPNWIDPLYRLMESDKQIGACQPKILDYNHPKQFEYAGAAGGYLDIMGYPFCRGRIFDTVEKDDGQYEDAKKITWATGACLMIRSSLFKELNGLDELFFAHMEEIDLCWRVQHTGYSVWVEPLSKVYHVGGGTLQKINPRKTFYNFRNNLLLILKNRPFIQAYLIIFLRLFLDGLAGIQFIFKGQFVHCWAIIKAHFAFYVLQFRYWKNRYPKKSIPTIYSGSILWQYFIKGKKKYKELG